MEEFKCPICGKILKIAKDDIPDNVKIFKIKCNKCCIEIEFEVAND